LGSCGIATVLLETMKVLESDITELPAVSCMAKAGRNAEVGPGGPGKSHGRSISTAASGAIGQQWERVVHGSHGACSERSQLECV
jgi:hypothetical protein